MFKSRSKRTILGGMAAVLVVAAAAYAYWTAGGSGTGSASAGTTSALTVNQTSTLNPMYPGDSPQTLSGNFDNTNSGPIHVDTVTASISSVTASGTCDATDFTLANAAMTVNANVPAGSAQGSWSGATIKFNNKATNQDGCKNATVHLSYAIS
jgi:phage-related minor tail protein